MRENDGGGLEQAKLQAREACLVPPQDSPRTNPLSYPIFSRPPKQLNNAWARVSWVIKINGGPRVKNIYTVTYFGFTLQLL